MTAARLAAKKAPVERARKNNDNDDESVQDVTPERLARKGVSSLTGRVTALELTCAALADAILDADELLAAEPGQSSNLVRDRFRQALAPRVTTQMNLFDDLEDDLNG